MKDSNDIVVEIQKCKTLLSLLPSEQRSLAAHCTSRLLERGEFVFQPGDESDCLFLLVNGRAVLSHRENGKRAVIESIWPYELTGQCALVHHGPRAASCEIVNRATVIRLPLQPIKEAMQTNLQFTNDVLENVGTAMRQLTYRLVSVLTRPKRLRLLDVLQNLAQSHGVETDSGVLLPSGYTHQELGEMIGATRETVTVSLAELKRDKVIDFHGRQVIVLRRPTAEQS